MTQSQLSDDDEVNYEVGRSWDDKMWTLYVKAQNSMSEREFAGALISLGKDILGGKISWDDAEELTNTN